MSLEREKKAVVAMINEEYGLEWGRDDLTMRPDPWIEGVWLVKGYYVDLLVNVKEGWIEEVEEA